MDAPRSYVASVAGIATRLRADPPTHPHLNRAAGEIDRLGRLLHGLDLPRHRDIATSLMGAVGELQAAMEAPEHARGGGVARAVEHLQAAMANLRAGDSG